MKYSLKDYKINIPENLIAQYPSKFRGQSRLLVIDRKTGSLKDDYFNNIPDYITSTDCIIYNDARVINARLFGEKYGTGARLEILLTRKLNTHEWLCLIRPARRVKRGTKVRLPHYKAVEVVKEMGDGLFRIRFSTPVDYEGLKSIGVIPLPKYIKRKPDQDIDNSRYQTVYSVKYGAVASPTAGLHFNKQILNTINKKGALMVPITLFVDWGTFQPVRENDYRKHKIHRELFEISEDSARKINGCLEEKRRILCVGTTSVRTVESAIDGNGRIKSGSGETDLFIYPGYHFKCINGMITNFHMPDSTLILLVSAFTGKEVIEKAYNHAVEDKYRFFSYGDAMFIF